jgi:hypothetical protein
MSSTLQSDSELSALFNKENLMFPALPAELMQKLQQCAPQLWQSQAELPHAEDLPAWIRLAKGSEQDLLQVGFSGRGINSWSLHLNLVQRGLAVFLQCRWGNAYDDAASNRRRIEGVMTFVDLLIQRSAHAELMHVLPPKERLIASFADHYPSRWQWSSDGEEWNPDGDFTLLAALGALDERINAADPTRH